MSERRKFFNQWLKLYMWSPIGICSWSTLLLIYVNNLPNIIKNLKFFLLEDDTNIYCDGDTQAILAKLVNIELKTVKDGWM